jgi:FSR family fosmidomycin resistance protein-like MFS transporter
MALEMADYLFKLTSWKKRNLVLYSVAHFAVDFCCFFILFSGIAYKASSEVTAAGFLIYNIIAFGLQVVIGVICDKYNKLPSGFVGCVLVLLGVLIIKWYWLALIIGALGNAFFHIGGGIDVLKNGEGKMTPNGIFVATGALGVSLGTLAGKGGIFYILIPIFIMIFISILIGLISFNKNTSKNIKEVVPYKIAAKQSLYVIVFCAFLIVVLRGYIGTNIPVSWKAVGLLVIVPSICATLGKGIGGVLGDKFGARKVGTISLVLSMLCFIIGKEVVYIGLIGIVFFNITMPITLCILASKLPNNLGLAFGITTLGLLIGVMPSFFVIVPVNFKLYITVLSIIISAIFLRIIAIDELKK